MAGNSGRGKIGGATGYEYHLPVLLKEAIEYLEIKPDGNYIDGTLGGGGHSEEVLKKLGSNGKLISFDKDIRAIEHCKEKFKKEFENRDESRINLVNSCFSETAGLEQFRGDTHGILLDLGLSSRQLDKSRRGFSYRSNTPLDMRFGSSGKSAEEFLNAATEEELERIFRDFGEEPFSKTIARRISQVRRATPLKFTYDLRLIVEETVPQKMRFKSLSRIFQALRIAVNDELNILDKTLRGSLNLLAPGGRLVVISYHSLEDRIVKNFFKTYSRISKNKIDKVKSNNMPKLKIINAKPIVPGREEIINNPRARSAKMRVAEKME